ncbi:radical SAM family heme chaperone HemW [Campylobacter concisus]|uniref:radical SAM family heme chaperone HemW n=1 Tax=Campylobacter concisus TaxID=199 RepID=UPI000CD93AE5|nr:radical SAM family heme chaperone HemW [Campylobacter concisus]
MQVYIHVPFCESKCPYCAFGSSDDEFSKVSAYFKALCLDLNFQLKSQNVKEISTIFFGGGTPSAVNAKLYDEIFSILAPLCTPEAEITFEANPNSANLAWLKHVKNLGANRISFGAQSFFEDKLKFLGRIHSREQIFKAVENAHAAGFKSINLDLIYDTKFDTKRRLLAEVENLKSLAITHLSAYSLTLEENTPFSGKKSYKKDSDTLAKFMIEQIQMAGFKQYEISNFGQICKHNLGYWQGKNYLGVGAFSVGFKDATRYYAKSSIDAYIAQPTHREREILSQSELTREHIFLGLRSIVGVEAGRLSEAQKKRANLLVENEKLLFKEGKFYNPNFLLSDEIALFIEG